MTKSLAPRIHATKELITNLEHLIPVVGEEDANNYRSQLERANAELAVLTNAEACRLDPSRQDEWARFSAMDEHNRQQHN